MNNNINNNLSTESFITFCDDMTIVNESMITKALSKLQSLFARLVLFIEKKIKSCKDSKLKTKLMNLLSRAKRGLANCKSLNEHNPEMVKRLQNEANNIQNEVKSCCSTITKEFKEAVEKKDKILVRVMLKDSMLVDTTLNQYHNYITYASSKFGPELFDEHDGDELTDNMNMEFVKVVSNFSKKRLHHLEGLVKAKYTS